MATLRDVASRAGVSSATVSHVVNGTKVVSPEVQLRVREALSELKYLRNRSATALRTGCTQTLGLLLPDLANPYFTELATAATRRARELGYATLLFDSTNSPEQEADGMTLLCEHRVDGILWVPTRDASEDDDRVMQGLPIVNIDRRVGSCNSVGADHKAGGALVAAYVASIGHKRVGLLSGPQTIETARLRREAFVAGSTGLEVVWEHEVPYTVGLPSQAVESLLSGDATMIVAANDVIAISVLELLASSGIRVPQQVSVIGFDDIAWARLVSPTLTTVRQPVSSMGVRAVDMIVEALKNPQAGLAEGRNELFAVEVVERESTMRLGVRTEIDGGESSGPNMFVGN